jgi:hypothetical protein
MDRNEEAAAREGHGWWIAATFFSLVLVAAILFVMYVLLWDGGAHT